MKKKYLRTLVALLIGALSLLTGCGLNFTVKDPVPSTITYDSQGATPATLTIVDGRTGMDSHFLLGQIGAGSAMSERSIVKLSNVEDPLIFLAANLEKEMAGRQIPVKCIVAKNKTDGMTLTVHRYQIASIRATSFSPWEALHIFSGTLSSGGKKTMIKSYFYNGKVPVWSMDEILDPCFNIPMSIMVKDIASKINRAAFHLSASDQKVAALSEQINGRISAKDYTDFWKVLELGYSNNPKAVEHLKKLAQTGDEFFKACAISSIGTLGAAGELEFLKKAYTDGWYNDRYMALKAIGDLGTVESLQVLNNVKSDPRYEKEGGIKYCVDLYLQQ